MVDTLVGLYGLDERWALERFLAVGRNVLGSSVPDLGCRTIADSFAFPLFEDSSPRVGSVMQLVGHVDA